MESTRRSREKWLGDARFTRKQSRDSGVVDRDFVPSPELRDGLPAGVDKLRLSDDAWRDVSEGEEARDAGTGSRDPIDVVGDRREHVSAPVNSLRGGCEDQR